MIHIEVHERINFTKEEVEKHILAVNDAVKALNSKRFKQNFLKLKLTNTDGLTNLEIYEKLMSGADDLNPAVDRDIDVYVEMYFKNNKVVGWTKPSINKTYLNRKFFKNFDSADVACNLVHEYLHKVGFDHHSAKEHTSVPYAIGYLVEDSIREMWKNPGLYEDDDLTVETPVEQPVEVEEPVEAKKLYCKRLWYTLWLKKVCWYE
jgi:hypothetical protein